MQIGELAASLLPEPGLFLIDVAVTGTRVRKKVLVIIDGDQGASIDDCARLSRALSERLDETDLIDENYVLEVSTPGVDHPLKLARQYKKNIGRGFKITLKDKSLLKGKLIHSTDESIKIEVEEKIDRKTGLKTMEIPFDQIDKAFVQISFK